MSEQANIIAEMQEIIMRILKTGTASEADGKRIDELEDLMSEQKCYQEIDHAEHEFQGEEIAALFFKGNKTTAVEKMCECGITPKDFFGFSEYHFDENEVEEVEMFTETFIADINKLYQSQCESK